MTPPSPAHVPGARPPEQTDTPDLRRLASDRDWHGYLTLENLDAVAQRLRDLIGDGKLYTAVCSSEDFWSLRPPEVRTSCTSDKIDVCHEPFEGRPAADISINDQHYLHYLTTQSASQVEARALPEEDRPPYLHFKYGRVEITDHAPAGNKIFQVYAVEEREL